MIRSFTDLEIWQLSTDIVVKVYKLLQAFPSNERFGIVSQCKESVVSIGANITEGFGRYHYKDKIKFYYNSRGSLEETKSHLLVSDKLNFITQDNEILYKQIISDLDKLAAKLNSFINSVNNSSRMTADE